MKIRNGFVSNSSSSSFVIGSNEKLDKTLKENFTEFFPAENERTKEFIKLLADEIDWEFESYDGHETMETWKEYEKYHRDGWGQYNEEIPEEDIKLYKPFFDNWKYVHFIRIPSDGDGGTRLSQALRYAFPREYKSEKCEIKIECNG